MPQTCLKIGRVFPKDGKSQIATIIYLKYAFFFLEHNHTLSRVSMTMIHVHVSQYTWVKIVFNSIFVIIYFQSIPCNFYMVKKWHSIKTFYKISNTINRHYHQTVTCGTCGPSCRSALLHCQSVQLCRVLVYLYPSYSYFRLSLLSCGPLVFHKASPTQLYY